MPSGEPSGEGQIQFQVLYISDIDIAESAVTRTCVVLGRHPPLAIIRLILYLP